VEDHCAQPATREHLLGPQDGCGLDPVARHDSGRGKCRPVVDHDRDVGIAVRLQPGSYPGGAEACRRRDADVHGATPSALRPAVSGKPSIRLAFWTAWPAAPLPRLSIAAMAIARPVRGSARTATSAILVPVTRPVSGRMLAPRTRTNGSPL